MSDEQIYRVALGLTAGVGDKLVKILISYCGSASNVFKMSRGKLLKIPGIGPKTADALLSKHTIADAEQECENALRDGATLLFFTDEAFPQRLKTIDDAPSLLYYKGKTNLNAEKIVAIVGTRTATAYGKNITDQIIADLNRFTSLLVVSGLAYGIDITAHKAALKYNVPTVAVMASGIDIVYPAGHKPIAQEMLEQGGLLTEHAMGTKPDAPYFPARNRIIAGMADVLIVVEAAVTGGALITAEIANSYNKDVFAVPGNIGSTYSEGCNQLIRAHKAHIFTNVNDLEYIMNWEKTTRTPKKASAINIASLSAEEKQVVDLLGQAKDMLMDDISWKTQIPIGQLASLLLSLELQGFVKALPGKKFTLL